MTIPVWVLLGFAVWTLLVLMLTVGVYRWALILTGRMPIREWRADGQQGPEWYRRAMRAHANCVENLPVYGAIVVVIVAAGLHDPWLDRLSSSSRRTLSRRCDLRSTSRRYCACSPWLP
jgi:uncharacterized MAPEG superfamily protein